MTNVQVQQHMDLGTLLHHVDHHMYPTCAPFLADLAIIPQAWRQYHQVTYHALFHFLWGLADAGSL